MFTSSIVAEILRIARVTFFFQSFLTSVQTLVKRMLSQGAHIEDIKTPSHRIFLQFLFNDIHKKNQKIYLISIELI